MSAKGKTASILKNDEEQVWEERKKEMWGNENVEATTIENKIVPVLN
jgi:hypothetical protein